MTWDVLSPPQGKHEREYYRVQAEWGFGTSFTDMVASEMGPERQLDPYEIRISQEEREWTAKVQSVRVGTMRVAALGKNWGDRNAKSGKGFTVGALTYCRVLGRNLAAELSTKLECPQFCHRGATRIKYKPQKAKASSQPKTLHKHKGRDCAENTAPQTQRHVAFHCWLGPSWGRGCGWSRFQEVSSDRVNEGWNTVHSPPEEPDHADAGEGSGGWSFNPDILSTLTWGYQGNVRGQMCTVNQLQLHFPPQMSSFEAGPTFSIISCSLHGVLHTLVDLSLLLYFDLMFCCGFFVCVCF